MELGIESAWSTQDCAKVAKRIGVENIINIIHTGREFLIFYRRSV